MQSLERTCFQTGGAWSEAGNLRSDVAIVYGIDPGLPARMATWRDRGYRIHVMTGVSWGQYQDYLYGRFDGVNHEDEAQTDRNGNKISHGGDVYYMCPGENFGKFLCVGVQRALDAGAEAIHLEEPEFWVRGGYSEGFKREWRRYYGEEWSPPHSSVDAQWRASKLKYYLYRRALQQVFDHIQAFNQRTGRGVRCYVPTHSLLNYAHWRIVSPESSLARLTGCDGYIAQVWTGTSRTPNQYRGVVRERTFETAFLEYGAMQNLVRGTGRTVWYLNDPIEDDPKHDWTDYRTNWESTLVASLLQPEVWQFEVAPWPERVFGGKYPANSPNPQPIPPAYATELQVVMQALNDLRQPRWRWESGTTGIGLIISDTLMFQRGDPNPGDRHLGNVYGLALPLLKRGIPVMPVQLENLTLPRYLRGLQVLFVTYRGMKPMSPDVHEALASWVRAGGRLVVVDDDADPYLKVREWWNSDGRDYATPRLHLFELLGLKDAAFEMGSATTVDPGVRVGKGRVFWRRSNPADLAASPEGDGIVAALARQAVGSRRGDWKETNYLLLRRGPYLVAAGLDESQATPARSVRGRFVDLFDPELAVVRETTLPGGARRFLLDLDQVGSGGPRVLASACKALPVKKGGRDVLEWVVEGIGGTRAVVLLRLPKPARQVQLDGAELTDLTYSSQDRLLWVRFENESRPRTLSVRLD
ncbi:MAG: hypothetical protein JNK85_14125 [Verrucomicrobiales bacterium]|nr:hypothetical protein [Verrucomicrobiales bacterium]